uniref:Uncharacterized protein LOC104222525 n=1 Tax=Nicotiana sylvestris TaxID=4096 RepID=A0A1U7W4D2_NICSY|nr:PREDICTED: uncharacterized protein LOC104222525 [Nicotiana sylvestris]
MHVKWEPPNQSFYKLNSDEAACTTIGAAGYGGVIRDSNGNWIVGYTGSLKHTTSLHMELMGLLQGLRLAHLRQLTPSEVVVDAKELVDPRVTHTYREQNQVVDSMAKHDLMEYRGPSMLVF